MDGEFRALPFDSASTTQEVIAMIKDRIGLPPSIQGYSLFEVFGALERNMLSWEKVGVVFVVIVISTSLTHSLTLCRSQMRFSNGRNMLPVRIQQRN